MNSENVNENWNIRKEKMVESDLIFLLPRAFQSDGFIDMFPFSASLFLSCFSC